MINQVVISQGNPRHPDVVRLLQKSHKLLLDLFPTDDIYALSLDELCEDDVRFYIAIDNGRIIGCAALSIKDSYGELKSMFVDECKRGLGVAQKLLEHILLKAKKERLFSVKLETGFELKAAVKLYKKNNFKFCDRFGDYTENETSIFMQKII